MLRKRVSRRTIGRVAAFFLLVAGLSFQEEGESQVKETTTPTIVSMFQLISTPERFDGQLVTVVGYLTIGRERCRLHPYETDAVHLLGNAVGLEDTDRIREEAASLNRKYVIITGVFKKANKEQVVPGIITKVARCEFWSDPARPISTRLKEIPGVEPDHPEP